MVDRATLHRAIRGLALRSESGDLALALLLTQAEESNDDGGTAGDDAALRCCAAEALRCIGESLAGHGDDLAAEDAGPADLERVAENLCAAAQILAGLAFELRRSARGSGARLAAQR